MRVNGNLNGIRDKYIEELDRLYEMDNSTQEVIKRDILDILADMTAAINKEISVFINRRGKVLDVSVGDNSVVRLPSLDLRRGYRRLSGVRCIHTHPESSGRLSNVDISALTGLRLDAMAAVGVREGKIESIYIGYLEPKDGALGDCYMIEGPYSRDSIYAVDIIDRVRKIDSEILAGSPESTGEGRRERAILVGIDLSGMEGDSEDLIHELEDLAEAAGVEVVEKILQKRNKVDNACYIGSGKAGELGLIVQAYDIDTIIFDDELSGAQVRNLEEITNVKVIDRTTLILDIFASRAQTREGKLQVELAQLKYRMPRLLGMGKVLSRTGGGIGTRGPGEKKLEIDRRHIRARIGDLEEALDEVRKNRSTQREKRRSSRIPMISLVGYTNAGKSTMRNYLAKAYQSDPSVIKEDVYEADMLFATLDPTTRLIRLPKGHDILVSDTVGFIRKLPHDLVEAFKATLEEVVFSDMLVHVIDASASNAKEQFDAVNRVLNELGVLNKPIITVLNKIDRIKDKDSLNIIRSRLEDAVEVSALNGDGMERFISLLEEKLYSSLKIIKIRVPYDKMSIKSNLYGECKVLNEDYEADYAVFTVEADEEVYGKYRDYILDSEDSL